MGRLIAMPVAPPDLAGQLHYRDARLRPLTWWEPRSYTYHPYLDLGTWSSLYFGLPNLRGKIRFPPEGRLVFDLAAAHFRGAPPPDEKWYEWVRQERGAHDIVVGASDGYAMIPSEECSSLRRLDDWRRSQGSPIGIAARVDGDLVRLLNVIIFHDAFYADTPLHISGVAGAAAMEVLGGYTGRFARADVSFTTSNHLVGASAQVYYRPYAPVGLCRLFGAGELSQYPCDCAVCTAAEYGELGDRRRGLAGTGLVVLHDLIQTLRYLRLHHVLPVEWENAHTSYKSKLYRISKQALEAFEYYQSVGFERVKDAPSILREDSRVALQRRLWMVESIEPPAAPSRCTVCEVALTESGTMCADCEVWYEAASSAGVVL